MEDFIQVQARNKDEAIIKASIELGTSSDNLEIEIVSEGSTGFFGFGNKPAIIKARRKIKEETLEDLVLQAKEEPAVREEKPQEKKPAKKAEKPAAAEKAKQEGSAKKSEKPSISEKAKQEEPAEPKAEKEEKPAKVKAPKEEKPAKEKPAKEKSPKEKAPKEKPAKEKTPKDKPSKEKKAPKEPEKPAVKPARPIVVITDPEEIKDVENRAKVFLLEVFRSMNLGEVEIVSRYNAEEGCLEVDFEGEDMGILIGKRGQTLDSLQYLTSLVVNKGKADYIRVKLDTEDYRRRRKDTLENLAKGIAFKVKKTRKPVVLEPMNPYERRIIHSTLQNHRFVETVSEGEEPYRHVVVRLKKN